MIKQFVSAAALTLCGVLTLSAVPLSAQEDAAAQASEAGTSEEDDAQSLEQLLEFVKQGQTTEMQENRRREQRFRQNKEDQAAELKAAEDERTRQENISSQLENEFEENEVTIAQKQEVLRDRLGTLSELFGHLTSTAGDLASNLEFSITSAEFPNREEYLNQLIKKMSASDQLPSIEEIERVWFELQREMIESGKVVKFEAEVAKPNGDKVMQDVVRVGVFNVVSEEGQYLTYVPSKGTLEELARQPSGNYTDLAEALANADSGMKRFGVDPTGPTGGSYLAAMINSPTLEERWHQGGYIGYAITAVGVFAFILAIFRLIVLSAVGSKVNSQLKSDKANDNNPLGRVLKIHEDNPSMDTETLELKLSEGILKETPKLESGLTLLKIIAAVAPLMGLLGTVTGMIVTFQAITIFGAGDPKAMAGGISGALVTTVLGLLVAIPTVLLHTVVNGRAQRIIHILNEQSTGIVAEHTESNLGK
ncbi:MotA/TolQ/ExbB proton channel family protein [Chromatocurvus halotolerans]|uniref:Outer membrane transport energization protein ExbB n=1 Tax=Chromatocurvus halotolerans TaxID=1132028 RepID=A0A4R2KP91_9GAMM|nr:MotA/TolQ/ExbB proton channel family protein [Chromatocurvus halotolerans]TCO75354.1 outer membrane transport energization protein ExbB [Chromatocurvus halotolerans]